MCQPCFAQIGDLSRTVLAQAFQPQNANSRMNKDLAASVRARLLNLAKADQTDFNQVLVRYALERLLYRLSQLRSRLG